MVIFGKKAKKYREKRQNVPHTVDDSQRPGNISNLFKNNYDNLYNCVSFDENEMINLKNDINKMISEKSGEGFDNCSVVVHPEEVKNAINKLKCGKTDASLPLRSDNLIFSSDICHGHLSLLFTMMLKHGFSPMGMLIGTMVPIPKGRYTDLANSKNFRAITISSLLGKLLDLIVLSKEEQNLITNDLQFGFKSGASTTMCTTMVRETISYYVNRGSNVYSLVLDATKAFDRVNYCKLFRILLSRNICPFICRLLLNMYINQKLRVRWGNAYSDEFTVTNGVKQGGVISPILYCVYIDGLISELIKSNVGCFMGGAYAGIFYYADDLKTLAPSVRAMRTMLSICLNYAERYDVKFNDKSQLIVYKSKVDDIPVPTVKINGAELQAVESVMHLGHILNEHIFECDASKCVKDFNVQTNLFLSDFKNASSFIRNYLFFKYCTSFYGSQFLPIYNNRIMNSLYVAWRMAVRRVWRIPWTSHSILLPHITGTMPPDLTFAKRSISFINFLLNSNNKTVKMITGMGLYSRHSIIGKNFKYLTARYELNSNNVLNVWNNMCNEQLNQIRISEQIKELCSVRDSYQPHFLSRPQLKVMIDHICTY